MFYKGDKNQIDQQRPGNDHIMPESDSALTPSDNGDVLDAIVISDSDNIAVCLRDIDADSEISIRRGQDSFTLAAIDPIPRGHKIAVRQIAEGDKVLKYGEVIGQASQHIGIGNHVHVHNVVD